MPHWTTGPQADEIRAKLRAWHTTEAAAIAHQKGAAGRTGLTRKPESIERQRASIKATIAARGGLAPEHLAKIRAAQLQAAAKRRHPERVCPSCQTLFHPNARVQKFCSRRCADQPGAKARAPKPGASGAKHHNWQGGITPVNHAIRTSLAYAIWRDAVFVRDDYVCVLCGERGGDKHADHIKPFATHPELRFDVANGRTLCPPCHRAHGANPRRISSEISTHGRRRSRRRHRS